jgi:hypothetical protein
MGWQDRAREYSGDEYVAPEVNKLDLDGGGNYVSPASALKGSEKLGGGTVGTLGATPEL